MASPAEGAATGREADEDLIGGSVLRPGFRLVWDLIRPHPVPVILSILGALVFAGGTVLSTVVLGRVIDDLVIAAEGDQNPSTRSLVLGVLAVMVVAIGRAAGVITRRYFAGMTSERAQHRARRQLGSSYLSRPLAWFQKAPTGQLLAHVDSDAWMLVEVLHPLPFSIGVVGLAVFAGIALVAVDLTIALVALLIFPIMTITNHWYSKIVEKPMARSQERLGDVAGIAHESFEGALIVKTLGRTDAEVQRFADMAEHLRRERVHAGILRAAMHVLIASWPALGTVVVVLIGAFRVRSGDMTAGDIVQVAALFTLMAVPMAVFGFFLESLAPSLVADRRIRRATGLDRGEDNADHAVLTASPTRAIQRDRQGAAIEVSSLSYAFAPTDPEASDPELAVNDVSCAIHPGETVAIVGATGSGKSTLIALMAGLLPPASGTVHIGGRDVHSLSPSERAESISVVFQESFLLAASVRANIAMGRALTEHDIESAARSAHGWDFISKMPRGLDTVLGERGLTVSGGQRQRLALARAFAQRTPIVMLDDATSAVDTITEQRILGSLRDGTGEGHPPTLVIVAHRLATISLADRVIWIREGRVAGVGNHAELMADPNYEALVSAYEEAEA